MEAESKILESDTVEVTVSQIRAYFDGDGLPPQLEQALDEAQAPVFQKEVPHKYLIIKITGD